jgi:hypothetical protein
LFAGLNRPPKKSYATEYSYRTVRDHQHQLLSGWVGALAPLLFPHAKGFALDFHPIPFRGDATALEQHYLPMRGKAGISVLSFFAQEQESCALCYANANLTRRDQAGEAMRFVEFWHEITGADPEWLYLDSKPVLRYRRGCTLWGTVEAEPTRHLVHHPPAAWRGDPAPFASAVP